MRRMSPRFASTLKRINLSDATVQSFGSSQTALIRLAARSRA